MGVGTAKTPRMMGVPEERVVCIADPIKVELAKRELARRRFSEYLPYVYGSAWKRTRMSEFLATQVQDFIEDKTDHAYDILVIETPPQHGKSTTLTESLPSWYMGKYERRNVILASYNDDTAERFCRRNKDKIRSYGNTLFGITMKKERAEEIELAEGRGRMISRGIRAGITGNPGDLIIIDDPIKNREEADSPTWRSKIWEEWQNSIKSRLSAGAKVIIIMTPWHEDDLAARVLRNEKNARLIRLPVEAEENDPMGRAPGDALCPELGKDNKWLEDFRHAYINDPEGGIRAWTALYQCSPRVEEGNLIRREWWRYFSPKDEPEYATELISVDATFKKTDTSDYVAITVWGKRGNYYYCRYCLNKRMTFTETLTAIRQVRQLYPYATRVLVEDKANGSAIIDVLSQEQGMFCIPINPKGGKESRVNAVAPAIEAGNVLLPEGAAWVEPFIDQFAKFPNDIHDDMCFVAGTKIATLRGDVPIEDIRVGDKVLSPFGIDTVERCGKTGEKPVIERAGLTGTEDHPIFYAGEIRPLAFAKEETRCSHLSLKELIRWRSQKLSISMELPIVEWAAPGAIILANQRATKDGSARKGFMSRFGSFIAEKLYRRAITYTIKMATLLITSTAIWSAYRLQNTRACLRTGIKRKTESILKRFGRSQQHGTVPKKDESGIDSTLRSPLENERRKNMCANTAEPLFSPSTITRDSALTLVMQTGDTTTRPEQRSASAPTAGESSKPSSLPEEKAPKRVADTVEQSSGVSAVYNLSTAKYHWYYANGVLVHNCDSASQALTFMIYSSGRIDPPLTPKEKMERDWVAQEQDAFLDNERMYDPYHRNDDFAD